MWVLGRDCGTLALPQPFAFPRCDGSCLPSPFSSCTMLFSRKPCSYPRAHPQATLGHFDVSIGAPLPPTRPLAVPLLATGGGGGDSARRVPPLPQARPRARARAEAAGPRATGPRGPLRPRSTTPPSARALLWRGAAKAPRLPPAARPAAQHPLMFRACGPPAPARLQVAGPRDYLRLYYSDFLGVPPAKMPRPAPAPARTRAAAP